MRQVVVLLVAVLSACGSALDVADRQTTTTAVTVVTTTAPPTTSTTAPTPATTVPMRCGEETAPFVQPGNSATARSGAGDAATIASIGASSLGTCDRITVDFLATGGAPATAIGVVELTVLPRIVRLTTSATATAVADLVLGSGLADTAYVVRGSDGSLTVDIHVSAPASARLTLQREPGRAVVDLEPAGAGEDSSVPLREGNVVVTDVAAATYPLVITGYTRTFEANVVGQLRVDGEVIVETVTMAADWLDTWGAFELRFEQGPVGPIDLFVGDTSASTGELEGVVIGLEVPENAG